MLIELLVRLALFVVLVLWVLGAIGWYQSGEEIRATPLGDWRLIALDVQGIRTYWRGKYTTGGKES